VVGCCEHGNEPSGSIKCGEFLTIWGTISSSGRSLLNGISYATHDCELSMRVTLTVQFIQASVLCNRISALLGQCLPVCGVARVLIRFYRGRKWHLWRSWGGSSFYKRFSLLVYKLNEKHYLSQGRTNLGRMVSRTTNMFSVINSCSSFPCLYAPGKEAPDDRFTGHCRNCGSSVWNFLRFGRLAPRIWGGS
jgi:hypothetical protein